MARIVHLIGDDEEARLPEGEVPLVKTRCGRRIDRPVVTRNVGPTRYDLVARNGNLFFCTPRRAFVTCVKCRNLIGATDDRPSRPADPAQRTVAHAHAAIAGATGAHANSRARKITLGHGA